MTNARFAVPVQLVSLALTATLMTGCGTDSTDPAKTEAISSAAETKEQRPEVVSLDDRRVPLLKSDDRAVVCVFVATDCPIANRYAPAIQSLADEFLDDGVRFCLVYAGGVDEAAEIKQHLIDYGYSLDAYQDPELALARHVGVTVTPEAAVLDATGAVQYAGRIDNWYSDFGKKRREPTTHDLRKAIQALLENRKVPPASGKAIGCYIPGLASPSE